MSGPQGRDFCSKYQGLLSERASGEQAKKWAGEIHEINAKLANAKGTNAMAEADPQAAVLAKLASLVLPGIKTEDVQTALAIFVAVLLEIGSGFGMYVAFSTWRLYDRAAPSVPSTATARQLIWRPTDERGQAPPRCCERQQVVAKVDCTRDGCNQVQKREDRRRGRNKSHCNDTLRRLLCVV